MRQLIKDNAQIVLNESKSLTFNMLIDDSEESIDVFNSI